MRQSAFALLGDLSKTCPAIVQPSIAQLMPVVVANLEPGYVSVCNNAAWAAGEMAVKLGADEIREHIPALVNPLVEIINSANSPRTLLENTGITLGRCSHLLTKRRNIDLNHSWQVGLGVSLFSSACPTPLCQTLVY